MLLARSPERALSELTHDPRGELASANATDRARPGPVRSWAEALLGRELPRGGSLLTGYGPVRETLLEAIDTVDPEMVILPAGALAQRLARSGCRPLLVARAPSATQRIVALTDFSDPAFPVLRRAAELGAADARSADLVVVGTYPRSLVTRVGADGPGQRVAPSPRRACCSCRSASRSAPSDE